MLTLVQLEMRRTGLGASEWAAVLGSILGRQIDPHNDATDVWLSKVAEPREDRQTGATEAGNEIEEAIGRMYERRTGAKLYSPKTTVRHPELPWILATVDFESTNGPAPIVEAKNVGAHMLTGWGPDGTSVVPEDKWIQVQVQAEVRNVPRVDIAALLTGTDLRIYPIERDRAFMADAIELVAPWWEEYVVGRTPPPATPAQALAISNALYPRSRGVLLHATEEARLLRAELEAADAELEAAKARWNAGEALAKAMTGDADGIVGCWTWREDAKGKLRWSELLKVLRPPPELVAKYTGAPGRRFLLKEEKGGRR